MVSGAHAQEGGSMPLERMANVRPRGVAVLALFTFALAVAGCGGNAAVPSAGVGSTSAASSPGVAASTTAATELTAIGCATDDPEDVGALTGAWSADDGGVYYIRQVGDCVWWFGTDLARVEPGQNAQRGFSNVAAGHVEGSEIELEWADVPLGNILGGGGLTVTINEGGDSLQITKQRGDWGFGAKSLRRIDATPSESATP
jgi:hypothetical protein